MTRVKRGAPSINLRPRQQRAHGLVSFQFNRAQFSGNVGRDCAARLRVLSRAVHRLVQLHHPHQKRRRLLGFRGPWRGRKRLQNGVAPRQWIQKFAGRRVDTRGFV